MDDSLADKSIRFVDNHLVKKTVNGGINNGLTLNQRVEKIVFDDIIGNSAAK